MGLSALHCRGGSGVARHSVALQISGRRSSACGRSLIRPRGQKCVQIGEPGNFDLSRRFDRSEDSGIRPNMQGNDEDGGPQSARIVRVSRVDAVLPLASMSVGRLELLYYSVPNHGRTPARWMGAVLVLAIHIIERTTVVPQGPSTCTLLPVSPWESGCDYRRSRPDRLSLPP